MQSQSGADEAGFVSNPIVQSVITALSWIEQTKIKIGDTEIAVSLPDGETAKKLSVAPISDLIIFLESLCVNRAFWKGLPANIEGYETVQTKQALKEWLVGLLGELKLS